MFHRRRHRSIEPTSGQLMCAVLATASTIVRCPAAQFVKTTVLPLAHTQVPPPDCTTRSKEMRPCRSPH